MAQRSNKEFILALVAVVLIGSIYAAVVLLTRSIPAAGDLFGHLLGVFGFILMLLTETLYSLRKRSRSARWGRMSSWLQFHIFTGLVGPFMVLLHTSWKFNGLAGITILFTIIIVLSGFVGRYIYTRIPRTADGIELDTSLGKVQAVTLAQARRLMALWYTFHIPIGIILFLSAFTHVIGALYYATLLR